MVLVVLVIVFSLVLILGAIVILLKLIARVKNEVYEVSDMSLENYQELLGVVIDLFIKNEKLKKLKKDYDLALFKKKIYQKYIETIECEVIKNIMDNYFFLNYWYDKGIDEKDYSFAKYEDFDIYKSNNLITGRINNYNFSLARVHTEVKTDDGIKTVFLGEVAIVDCPNINSFLYVGDKMYPKYDNIYHIKIDNTRFENRYDVFSDNKILAMQILTPEVTTKWYELMEKYFVFAEFKIWYDKLYIRFKKFIPGSFERMNIDDQAIYLTKKFVSFEGQMKIIEYLLKVLEEVTKE